MNYIFLADGYETVEALAVVDMMRRAALPLTLVSMNETEFVTTSHQVVTKADTTFDKADLSDARMLILPGGMPGTANLEENEALCDALKKHAKAGGDLAAICAAPRVLGRLGLLEGKRATCFPGNEELLKGAKVSTAGVESDGNVITGKGMGAAVLFGAAIVERLKDKETADRILAQIQYQGD
ncbi:MAG: DJ-1/PfpI family protein [Lachnospiraceae bacterium]|nr:DJ-1/PfpI family protein [Lachnospiraceae bacterium]